VPLRRVCRERILQAPATGGIPLPEAILDRWGGLLASPPDEWLKSFKLAQQHQHRRTMLCNWLYYFTKECYAKLGFVSGKYRFQNSVKKAIRQMEVKA